MKNRKRTPALLLSLILAVSLCACADERADSSESPDPDASPTLEVDLSRDILDFSAGLSAGDTLLTVNGTEVKADLFLYFLYHNCDYLMYQYYYYYGAVPSSLAAMAESLMDSAIRMAAAHTITRQKAVELACPLTDEQKAEVEEAMMLNGQEDYEEDRARFGLTDETMGFFYTMDYYYNNVRDAAVPQPTADDLNNYVYQTKHILLKTVDTSGTPTLTEDGEYVYPALDEETVAEKRALAEDILARLRAAEGEEQLELFDELMEEYSEDGRDADGHIDVNGYEAVLSDGAAANDMRMVAPYEEASLALGIGEISDIVESSFGCHIILRQKVEFRNATAEKYADNYREYLFSQLLDQWVDEADTVRSDSLANLDVDDFYWRYVAYQDALTERYAAAGDD